ncbi:MAG: Eco57I restriction-modification methylase domain-containing protein [Prevotellaceae bacterium]|jgi:hypothetical protein|nr:Eco57I restriction-modification methylase domain-containing protein [Prevotellaceae bacterium]
MIKEARKYQAFYTKSTPIVDYMVEKLSLHDSDRILDPCGGDGVFVEAILAENEFAYIDVCELNPQSIGILSQKFSACPNVRIRECDTLLDMELGFNSSFGGTYNKIIANPPYGAWQDYKKRGVLKKLYPDLYAKETYTLFLYRCIELLKDEGILSFIIPDTFLSLHLHKAIRQHLLTRTQILELSLFPSNFFPDVNFGYANLSIITLKKKSKQTDCLDNHFRVINRFSKVKQLKNTKDVSLNHYVFLQKNILNNADHAFYIADNDRVLKIINDAKLKTGDVADCVTGFYSGDDKRFLQVINPDLKNGKNYDLVNIKTVNDNYKNNPDILNGLDGEQFFIPIVKGGNTKYLKPESWFMTWSKQAVNHYKTDTKARFQNPCYYFRYGVGVPMISSSSITASLIENKLFDQSIVGIFPKNDVLTYYLLAFFNSPTCNQLIRTINPSANNPANYIKKIPFIIPDDSMLNAITEKTKNIVSQMKVSGNYDETVETEVQELIKRLYGF